MREMTKDEIRSFLMDTARTGKLATVREDGRPHVAPIWFTLDGEDMLFMTWHTSVKGKNIQRDGQVAICVDDEQPPYAYVIYEGRAEFVNPTQEEFLKWSTEIGGRYMGSDKAEAYGKRNAVEGEMLFRVKPAKIIAKTNIAD